VHRFLQPLPRFVDLRGGRVGSDRQHSVQVHERHAPDVRAETRVVGIRRGAPRASTSASFARVVHIVASVGALSVGALRRPEPRESRGPACRFARRGRRDGNERSAPDGASPERTRAKPRRRAKRHLRAGGEKVHRAGEGAEGGVGRARERGFFPALFRANQNIWIRLEAARDTFTPFLFGRRTTKRLLYVEEPS
jgi:hypothetical protein